MKTTTERSLCILLASKLHLQADRVTGENLFVNTLSTHRKDFSRQEEASTQEDARVDQRKEAGLTPNGNQAEESCHIL